MKSPLAKARDKWLNSKEGKGCCEGTTAGQYLQNRLELAFLAGAKFSDERVKQLDRKRASARIMLIAARSAIAQGGEANEEVLTKIIKELE